MTSPGPVAEVMEFSHHWDQPESVDPTAYTATPWERARQRLAEANTYWLGRRSPTLSSSYGGGPARSLPGEPRAGGVMTRQHDDRGRLASLGVVGAFPMATRKALFVELQPLVTTLDGHPWDWAGGPRAGRADAAP